MNRVDDHNAARWLAVRYMPTQYGPFPAGWYVIRTCPCHWGVRVTEPRESEAAADRAKAALLKVAS